MRGVVVDMSAETCSFRDPGGQLYHSCLPLPPFSTMVGIAGAAIGMGFEQAIEYFRKNKILAGVIGKNHGNGRDLWNYTKVISRKKVKSDIINREFLAKLNVRLFYVCQNPDPIDNIGQSFQNPKYCVTLGTSDDLAIIKDVSICSNIKKVETTEIVNTIVHGDISGLYEFDWHAIKNSPIAVNLVAPIVKKLPVDYSFSKKTRKGIRYETFTFVSDMVKLKTPVAAYNFGGNVVGMFSL